MLKENDARIISILTSFEDAPENMKRVSIRISSLTDDKEAALSGMMKDNFTVVYSGRDDLSGLPTKG